MLTLTATRERYEVNMGMNPLCATASTNVPSSNQSAVWAAGVGIASNEGRSCKMMKSTL
jgi:hypothetical protein